MRTKNKNIKEYLSFFPEETPIYKNFYDEFIKLVKDTHRFYVSYHVLKKLNIKEIPFQIRPLCYDLHSIYKIEKSAITFDRVYKYLNSLDSAKLVYIFKTNPKVDFCYNLNK